MIQRTASGRDAAVSLLQELGYAPKGASVGDPLLDAAVTAFQRDWQIARTGVLDYETLVVVTEVLDARLGASTLATSATLPSASAAHGGKVVVANEVLRAPEPRPQTGHGLARLVRARVAAADGSGAAELTVELLEHGFRDVRSVATSRTDADGRCDLAQPLTTARIRWPVEVRVLDGATVVATSGPLTGLRPIAEVDLAVGREHLHGPSDFERIAAEVRTLVASTAFSDLREDEQSQDITFLAANTSWSAQQLTDFVVAHRLAAHTRAEPSFFYALLRANALPPASLFAPGRVDLATPIEDLLARAGRLDPARVMPAIDDALRARAVPAAVKEALSTSVAALAQYRPAAGKPNGASAEVPKAHRRVARLVPKPKHAAALADAGLHSAAHIAAMGRTRFVRRFVEDGTFTVDEAHRVFTRAADVHAAAGILAADLRSLVAPAPAALRPAGLDERLQAVSTDDPTWATLFQVGGLCACADCRSVSSPAAYLVDVFEFLKHRKVVDRSPNPPGPPLYSLISTCDARDIDPRRLSAGRDHARRYSPSFPHRRAASAELDPAAPLDGQRHIVAVKTPFLFRLGRPCASAPPPARATVPSLPVLRYFPSRRWSNP